MSDSQNSLLTLENFAVSLEADGEEKQILRGVNLSVQPGEIHAIMGPNGSGKSTLSLSLLGHPSYQVTSGKIYYNGEDISEFSVDKRARMGIFLAFQYPFEIEGLIVKDFLRQAYNNWYGGTEKQIGVKAFRELVTEKSKMLGIDPSFLDRSLNVGFSGGEKKRLEMLQIAVLQPKLIILDEIDSGLDIDALKIVSESVKSLREQDSSIGILLITHYQRILKYIEPDFVHVMQGGLITRSGDKTLARELEQNGYGEI